MEGQLLDLKQVEACEEVLRTIPKAMENAADLCEEAVKGIDGSAPILTNSVISLNKAIVNFKETVVEEDCLKETDRQVTIITDELKRMGYGK